MRLPTPASRPRRCAGGPSGRALTPTPATTRPPRRGAPPGPRFAPAPRHDAPNTTRSRQEEGPASPSSRVDRPHSFRNDLVLCSKSEHAQETAILLSKLLHVQGRLIKLDALTPEGGPGGIDELVRQARVAG